MTSFAALDSFSMIQFLLSSVFNTKQQMKTFRIIVGMTCLGKHFMLAMFSRDEVRERTNREEFLNKRRNNECVEIKDDNCRDGSDVFEIPLTFEAAGAVL